MFDFASNMPAFACLQTAPLQSSDTAKTTKKRRGPAPLGKIANYTDRATNSAETSLPPDTFPGVPPSRGTERPTGSPELRPKPLHKRAKRAELWRLKEQGARWLPSRTNKCMRVRVQDQVEVAVYQAHDGTQAACFRGLVTCANSNACPLCAARIRTARALDLAGQLQGWVEDRQIRGGLKPKHAKNTLSLLTLTIRHHVGMRFAPMLEGLQKAQSRFLDRIHRTTKRNGGKSLAEEWGLRGYVRTTETTAGSSGWHPHAHIITFWERPLTWFDLQEKRKLLASIWRECVKRYLGADFEPTMANGLDLRCGSDAAFYVQKLAFEVSDAVTKKGRAGKLGQTKGRTPFELLDAAIAGDEHAGSLFQEFWRGSKGARIFEYSRRDDFKNLLRRLAKQGEEQSDDELVKGDRGLCHLTMTDRTWNAVTARRGAAAELLSTVETRGAAGAEAWLRAEGMLHRSTFEMEQSRNEILSWIH